MDSCSGHPCPIHRECVDQKAPLTGYTCAACSPGYAVDPADAQRCVNVDECAAAVLSGVRRCKSANSSCVDTDGSFVCKCDSGFTSRASGSCVDIDECRSSNISSTAAVPAVGVCDADNSVCTNTRGSYKCSCQPGFTGTGQTETGGCIEMNACVVHANPCSQAARCLTAPRTGPVCQCPDGQPETHDKNCHTLATLDHFSPAKTTLDIPQGRRLFTMNCTFVGTLLGNVKWTGPNGLVTNSETYAMNTSTFGTLATGVLTIINITNAVNGEYRCKATTSRGVTEAVRIVKVTTGGGGGSSSSSLNNTFIIGGLAVVMAVVVAVVVFLARKRFLQHKYSSASIIINAPPDSVGVTPAIELRQEPQAPAVESGDSKDEGYTSYNTWDEKIEMPSSNNSRASRKGRSSQRSNKNQQRANQRKQNSAVTALSGGAQLEHSDTMPCEDDMDNISIADPNSIRRVSVMSSVDLGNGPDMDMPMDGPTLAVHPGTFIPQQQFQPQQPVKSVNRKRSQHGANPQQPQNPQQPPPGIGPQMSINRRRSQHGANPQQLQNIMNQQQPLNVMSRQQSQHGMNRKQSQHGVSQQQIQNGMNRQQLQHGMNRQQSQHGMNRKQSQHGVTQQQAQRVMHPQQSQRGMHPQQPQRGMHPQQSQRGMHPQQSQRGMHPQQSQRGMHPQQSQRGMHPQQIPNGQQRASQHGMHPQQSVNRQQRAPQHGMNPQQAANRHPQQDMNLQQGAGSAGNVQFVNIPPGAEHMHTDVSYDTSLHTSDWPEDASNAAALSSTYMSPVVACGWGDDQAPESAMPAPPVPEHRPAAARVSYDAGVHLMEDLPPPPPAGEDGQISYEAFELEPVQPQVHQTSIRRSHLQTQYSTVSTQGGNATQAPPQAVPMIQEPPPSQESSLNFVAGFGQPRKNSLRHKAPQDDFEWT
ncbi:uncharacterized protein LOC135820799 [Sycon ciliatum]|uniref:uncharacterized protein LOC135820799 n=1 Tax=Sycon ciliatum TaxID=27933 RepID=UPI0031F67297